ncbi:MAG: DUF4304 domain-containing protein [bacterium]
MDSKEVNKYIRKIIRPILEKAGFTKFTARNAWRYSTDKIDVVNFQSFNSYNAGVLGITTYSFAVNLGCYLLYVPEEYPPKEKDGVLLPDECQCQFRARLSRKIKQPENTSNDIWYIDKKGKYLDKAIEDVANQLQSYSLNWFQRLSDKNEILNILCNEEESMENLWGFGNNPSPHRSYLTGYVAHNLGNLVLANQKLQEAVESGCYSKMFTNIDDALSKAL